MHQPRFKFCVKISWSYNSISKIGSRNPAFDFLKLRNIKVWKGKNLGACIRGVFIRICPFLSLKQRFARVKMKESVKIRMGRG